MPEQIKIFVVLQQQIYQQMYRLPERAYGQKFQVREEAFQMLHLQQATLQEQPVLLILCAGQ